jgi:hypothetical protein
MYIQKCKWFSPEKIEHFKFLLRIMSKQYITSTCNKTLNWYFFVCLPKLKFSAPATDFAHEIFIISVASCLKIFRIQDQRSLSTVFVKFYHCKVSNCLFLINSRIICTNLPLFATKKLLFKTGGLSKEIFRIQDQRSLSTVFVKFYHCKVSNCLFLFLTKCAVKVDNITTELQHHNQLDS